MLRCVGAHVFVAAPASGLRSYERDSLCENSAARKIRKKRPPCNSVFVNFRAAAAKIDLYAIRPKVFTRSVTARSYTQQISVAAH